MTDGGTERRRVPIEAIGPPLVDADEIACETFVRAWIATGDIRVETVKAYLFSIARILYIGRLRRQSRHTELTPAN